ncbi:MAG TPA: hypothetical protein VG013_41305 [Gemmataceae bacterium]|jgi:hypothetical protein|nr:hypothetical protein [Gemmataceae bacterium]
MNALAPLAAGGWWHLPSFYWHFPVLIVVISLVYSATKFDHWPYIMRESVRWMLRMAAFLVMVTVVLVVLDQLI